MSKIIVRYLTEDEKKDPKIISILIKIINETFSHLQKTFGIFEDLSDSKIVTQIVKNCIHECFVAVDASSKQILGVNFLSDRKDSSVRCVGPLAVQVDQQGHGIGKLLMDFCTKNAIEQGARSIRLVQDQHNFISFALYVKMGYKVKMCLTLVSGRPKKEIIPPKEEEITIREMDVNDIDSCCQLLNQSIGFARRNEILSCLNSKNGFNTPFVIMEKDKVIGFTTGLNINCFTQVPSVKHFLYLLSHLCRFICSKEDPTFFVPVIEQPELLNWCLQEGMKIQKNMNYMVYGEYKTPKGVYLPSIGM